MKYIAERSFQLETYTPVMARLKIGFLVKEIFERARSKSKCYKTLTQNLWVYSAHDITIANFLNALGLFDVSPHISEPQADNPTCLLPAALPAV